MKMKNIVKHIPSLGNVEFRPYITLGQMTEAYDIADRANDNSKASEFTNFVLSTMLAKPEKTVEEVKYFSPIKLEEIIDAIVDILEIREEFDDLKDVKPVQERFYQADMQNEHKFSSELAISIGNSIEKSISIYNDFDKQQTLIDSITKYGDVAQKLGALNLKSLFPDITSPIQGMMAELSDYSKGLGDITNYGNLSQILGTFLPTTLSPSVSSSLQVIANEMVNPFQYIVGDIARQQLSEPFLSQALLVSGINSSLIHSPTYVLQDKASIIEDGEDIKISERESLHQRLVEAYDILCNLELSLRDVIEFELRKLYDESWWKRGIPDKTREECEKRKYDKEKPVGTSHHPITYAYVHDYKMMIVRKDNWSKSFVSLFRNKSELETCFTWVGNVRDEVAHSRPISDDDYLMFIAGARWIQARIKL
jgi:hypothetical protein